MKLYNTLSRKIEEFEPLEKGKAGIYICGPTVYDYSHIGHARTYVNSDVLIRVLKWLDYDVKSVMNITDVGHLTDDADEGEDKMEKKARAEKKTAEEIADFYTKDFWQMSKMMNINKPDVICKATEYIKEMIELIKKLEEKGFVYKISDGMYFDTSKLKDYGKLARLDIEGLKEGARVEKKLEKKNPTDFALWKFSYLKGRSFDVAQDDSASRRQMEWDSPWGVGFPGWHIECSVMSMKHLGESFDIHTGGVDHIPVHHTNEIAQSEAVTGKPFVKYWFHNGFLMVEGEKMSKSLKNFLRVEDIKKKGFDPLVLRYLFLSGHYRTKMNFTWKGLEAADEGYKKLKSIVSEWGGVKSRTSLSEEKLQKLQGSTLKFRQAVENDLAMPQAMAVVWEMVKSNIPEQDKWELIQDWDRVLGLDLGQITNNKLQMTNNKLQITNEVEELVKKREELRKEKKYDEADEIKKQVEEKGFKMEDTVEGTVVKLK